MLSRRVRAPAPAAGFLRSRLGQERDHHNSAAQSLEERPAIKCGAISGTGCGPGLAGTRGEAVDHDRAGAALSFTASILGSGEVEFVAENGEERAVGFGIDRCAARRSPRF